MTSGIFIPELGHLAMILALCFALVQAVVPLLGAWRGDRLWMSLAQPAAWGQFTFLLFAFGWPLLLRVPSGKMTSESPCASAPTSGSSGSCSSLRVRLT